VIAAVPDSHRAPVIALVGTGPRISEACALGPQDIDFLRRTIHVREQRRPGGDFGQLKTGSSRRDIRADDAVLGVLAEEIRLRPRRDGLVFSGTSGAVFSKAMAAHEFDAIERTLGFTVSPHSLRNYFGASPVSRGVSVVASSHWLGRSSPEFTYRVYAYLKPDDEPAGRDAIAETVRQVLPHVYPLCTKEGSK
jgi:integrase